MSETTWTTTWTITFTSQDFDRFESAVADYVAKWGEHLTGKPYQDPEFGTNLAGIPTAVGNMAGTVLRKWVTKRDYNTAPITASSDDRHRATDVQPSPASGTPRDGVPAPVPAASNGGSHLSSEGAPPAGLEHRLIGDGSPCDGCGELRVDRYALYTPEREYGFCSVACMVVFVRTTWVEAMA